MTELKGEIDIATIIVENINAPPLSETDRAIREIQHGARRQEEYY